MPKIDELDAIPRRVLNIFYVLDTSGSMYGESINTLNSAMRETVDVLSDQAKTNADAQLKIAVLEFNSGCDWLQPDGPEDAEDFVWSDLKPRGITDMGHALDELDSKLDKNSYLSSMTGSYLPIIIFMTDGAPTDNYKKYLDRIRKNKWFARATKIGFALGIAPDVKMIAEIVGTSEAVLSTNDLDVFSRLIKFVSTTSSMMCSVVQVSEEPVTGADIVKLAVEQEDNSDDVTVGAGDYFVDLPEEDWDEDPDW